MISCFYDFHGKTYGAVSLAQIRSHVYGPCARPGFHMVPRPTLPPDVDQARRHDRHRQVHPFYEEYLDRHGRPRGRLRAGADPGLGRLVIPPDDFFPKLREVLRRAWASC
jgi:4-aminobutyrate aminotransferase-like enzyme